MNNVLNINNENIITQSERKRIEFILSLFPNNSKYKNEKLIWIIKKFGWRLIKKSEDNISINFNKAKSFIEKLTWIKDIIPLHITSITERYGKPIFPDWTEGEQKCTNYELVSESNVYLIKSRNIVMKIYFHLSKNEIKNYHDFQNKIAKQKYDIDYNWEIEGTEFNSINIEVMNLQDNNIIGNDHSAISFVPMSGYKNLREYWVKKYSPILKEIMRVIKEKNWLKNFSEYIDPMNIQIISLIDWTLYLRITDISDNINETLRWENLLDSENKKIEPAKEITKKLVWEIINIWT